MTSADSTIYMCDLSADIYELLDMISRNTVPRMTVPQLVRHACREFAERVAGQVEAQARKKLDEPAPASPEVPHEL